MQKKNKKVKIAALLVVIALTITAFATPFRAYAEFFEEGIELDIDTSTINLADAWGQIKNAAIIHLVAQKMKKCIEIDPSTYREVTMQNQSKETMLISRDDVVDKGLFFSHDWSYRENRVAVGPWLSRIITSNKENFTDEGTIRCPSNNGENGNISNMFVYILNHYGEEGLPNNIEENPETTRQERLELACNGTEAGLLYPVGSNDCSKAEKYAMSWVKKDENGSIITLRGESYAKQLYQAMKERSGNNYILDWDSLDRYNGVDGYYLYSNDYKSQCGENFRTDVTDSTDNAYRGYRIGNDGVIEAGHYIINESTNTARASFVVSEEEGETRTCTQLVDGMNRHIEAYVRKVNYEIYNICKAGTDEAIEDKRKELQEKYLSSENDKKADAEAVIAEYDRIQAENEYVEKTKDDGTKELISVKTTYANNDYIPEWEMSYSYGSGPSWEEMIDEGSIPTDFIWACRSHLPYIDVIVDQEADLAGALEDKFKDKCMEALDLGWLICPVINYISDAVDGLMDAVDGLI
ncbi:hypothetical protein IKF02_02515 [Candidatus Saccharibacteria bacterium]|nr:hypothetical protein [Candidatus Saccharibacteria bacterium]MBR3143587.1 hypothetical protein [Candidatus Saccharibacteria bacterium]